jgi:peptidoglycan/xylan/chitin deacetylase (PgdA/CDA1 family)
MVLNGGEWKRYNWRDMNHRDGCLFVLLVWILLSVSASAQSADSPDRGKRVVVTIDDLPLNGPAIGTKRLDAMSRKLTTIIKRRNVPAVGFVNESQIFNEQGEADHKIGLLNLWADAGVELANHTYSHISFSDSPLDLYQDDFVRGDTVISKLMKKRGRTVRYFRHPFLHMAPRAETETAFQAFLGARGYRVAPMTIDSVDWMVLTAYLEAKKRNDRESLRRVTADYLSLLDRRFEYSERAAESLFGRAVPQVLLLHANELNADNFAAVLEVIENRGYRFVSLDQALRDSIYRNPPKYTPSSDWLYHWSASLDKPWDPPAPPEYIQKAFREGLASK